MPAPVSLTREQQGPRVLVAALGDRDGHGPAGWGELDRVGEQVDEDLDHAAALGRAAGQERAHFLDDLARPWRSPRP